MLLQIEISQAKITNPSYDKLILENDFQRIPSIQPFLSTFENVNLEGQFKMQNLGKYFSVVKSTKMTQTLKFKK